MTKAYKGEAEAERRRFPRKPVKLALSYQCLSKDNVSQKETHMAEDLGAGGLAMRSRQALPKDQIVMLTLYIPREDKRRAGKEDEEYTLEECQGVNILGRVARCSIQGPGNYQVGIQFLDSDGQSRERLKKFLLDFRLYQSDSPLS